VDITLFMPSHAVDVTSLRPAHAPLIVSLMPLNDSFILCHNFFSYSITVSQFIYSATPAAIKAPIAIATSPIGLAAITKFKAA